MPWTGDIQHAQQLWFLWKKLRFSCHPGAKVRHQEAPRLCLSKALIPTYITLKCFKELCFWFIGKECHWMIQDTIRHFWKRANHSIWLPQQMSVWKKMTARVWGKFNQEKRGFCYSLTYSHLFLCLSKFCTQQSTSSVKFSLTCYCRNNHLHFQVKFILTAVL